MHELGGDILEEEEAIRAYFRDLEAARERQIAAGEDEMRRVARDLAVARARMLGADADAQSDAKSEYEKALVCEARAENFLAMARRPLPHDPVVRCQMGRIHLLLMRRIPPEILGHIFLATVETACDYAPFTCLTIKGHVAMQQAPYRLGLVCRRWREVALRTPAIWRIIWVDLSDVTRTTRGLYEMYVTTSFERAARRGVSLRMRNELLFVDWEEDKKHESARCTVLKLADAMMCIDGVAELNVWSLSEAMFDNAAPCTSLLSLDISGAQPDDLLCELSTLAPNLQRIVLRVFGDFPRIPRPHESVRSVKIATGYKPRTTLDRPHGLETLFHAFPQAREITLFLSARSYPTTLHLRHETLEVLRIESSLEIAPLAGRCTFPHLRELHVRLAYRTCDDPDDPIVQFFEAGACATIKILALGWQVELGMHFLEALRHAPLLETIRFEGILSTAFLEGLTKPDPTDGEWISPRLSVLHLKSNVDTPFSAEALLSLATQRKNAHGRGEAVMPLTQVTAWSRESSMDLDFQVRIRAVMSS